MATVNQSKRTHGKWELRYQADGKQRLLTFHSKKAADKARREIEHEIDMGTAGERLHNKKGAGP